ncbi:aminodeoxychorismate synthase component I [Heyndrickxia sp. NPDC080065]|uniref:aminodeoxychorismate synthase component I n=1 Tax=Heyndrickxia sp. NPDC080065 TaxID=3390568 RepID=UPI003D0709D3
MIKDFTQNIPSLLFEFADRNGVKKPHFFTDPIKVIEANHIEDVIPSLLQVQEQVSKGLFAAGYVSYEAAPAFDSAFHVHSDEKMPLLWFGIFNEPVAKNDLEPGSFSVSEWKPSIQGEEYHNGITKIKEAIENGDTYQVNYTTRLHAHFEGDDFSFYQQLASAQDSDYCAYLNVGEYQILSASPELFFRWDGDKIITKPMKGTVKRGKTVKEDEEKSSWLYHSEKNRAENLMIVDLLRNDLGGIAIPGTVQVDELFNVEQYPTVLQMTSTISAKTEEQIGIVDIFSSLFPCGSITGAPKISTMKLIEELEDSPREVYCGAIGYISPRGESVFNVPIRTVIIDRQTQNAVYGVGGGITWDSTTQDEFNEILTKASLLTEERPNFELLESIKLENGQYFLLDRHLHRLQQAAKYFNYRLRMDEIKTKLAEFAQKNNQSLLKVRLLVEKNGKFTVSGQPIISFEDSLDVKLSSTPIDKNDPYLYHKTTNRKVYDTQKTDSIKVFDVILWNQDGEVTEFTNGNIVVEIEEALYTPPITSGLLAGTFREELIQTGVIKERILTVQDLKICKRIWFINSVRTWVEVKLV